jgi:hypothetical protein
MDADTFDRLFDECIQEMLEDAACFRVNNVVNKLIYQVVHPCVSTRRPRFKIQKKSRFAPLENRETI